MTRRGPSVRWAAIDGVEPDLDVLNARQRAEELATDDERRRCVGARLLVLHAVSERTGCRFGDITLSQRCVRCGGPHGRPIVSVRGGRGPHVSIAHAGSLAIVAVDDHAVGVDVEDGPCRDWTRVEAVLKVPGHGLEVDPSMVGVDERGSITWRGPGPSPRVRVHDLGVAAGYAASVACRNRRARPIDVRGVDVVPLQARQASFVEPAVQ